MKEYIGYPEEILQENLLEELYEVYLSITKLAASTMSILLAA